VIILKEINILITNPLLHIVVEEFVWRKLVRLLYQNITSIDIVITIELKSIPESKVEESRRIYKSRRRKKIFCLRLTLQYPRQARAERGIFMNKDYQQGC